MVEQLLVGFTLLDFQLRRLADQNQALVSGLEDRVAPSIVGTLDDLIFKIEVSRVTGAIDSEFASRLSREVELIESSVEGRRVARVRAELFDELDHGTSLSTLDKSPRGTLEAVARVACTVKVLDRQAKRLATQPSTLELGYEDKTVHAVLTTLEKLVEAVASARWAGALPGEQAKEILLEAHKMQTTLFLHHGVTISDKLRQQVRLLENIVQRRQPHPHPLPHRVPHRFRPGLKIGVRPPVVGGATKPPQVARPVGARRPVV